MLYADDMAELRNLLCIVLSREGHTVETVADGSLALEKITATPGSYDLLITDHHMANMNGLELMTRVRQLPYRGKTLIFSSELSEDVHRAYAHLAVDRVLSKPVFPAELRRVIAKMFAPPA